MILWCKIKIPVIHAPGMKCILCGGIAGRAGAVGVGAPVSAPVGAPGGDPLQQDEGIIVSCTLRRSWGLSRGV